MGIFKKKKTDYMDLSLPRNHRVGIRCELPGNI